MKLFPALFYIACILLLGIRLRPLHSSTSVPFTTILGWQRELRLWLGWTYKLFTTITTWLREFPTSSLTTTDPTFPLLPLWKVEGHVKVAVTRYLNVRVLYTPFVVILDFFHKSIVGVGSGNQMKEMMVSLLTSRLFVFVDYIILEFRSYQSNTEARLPI